MKVELIVEHAEKLASVLREAHIDSALAREMDPVDWAEAADRAQVLIKPGVKETAIAILEAGERGRAA